VPITDPPDRQIPFSQHRQKLLANLEQASQRLQAVQPPGTTPWRSGLLAGARGALAALGYALAFAALGLWKR
jgi:hypothetical protein